MQKSYSRLIVLASLYFLTVCLTSCRKQLEVDAPPYTTNTEIVFSTDQSAASALTGIYANFSKGTLWTISYLSGLSADELTLDQSITNTTLQAFYQNALTSRLVNQSDIWGVLYPNIFYANAAIDGLTKSTTLTPSVKQQLLGEAEFIRAFCYFYLVNLYGDVPLILTTDYKQNETAGRTAKETVWKQIITDLSEAKGLLGNDYKDGSAAKTTTERVRPNKWVATALLARAYLYTGDYVNAEIQATAIIENTQFSLPPLNSSFLKASSEAIWQWQPVGFNLNSSDGMFFIIPAQGPSTSHPVYLSDTLLSAFEPGDMRDSSWVAQVIVGGKTYNYPYKYKIGTTQTTINEYTMVLRLGEQYLIRAEARINQPGKTSAGLDDLNTLRTRARAVSNQQVPNPLPPLPTTLNQNEAMKALIHERQVELFTEWGNRWFDIKRMGVVDNIMSGITPLKGGIWNTNSQLYPIFLDELGKDPNLKQNEGY